MDFTKLVVAPLAVVTTIAIIGVALLAGRYSEPNTAIFAFCGSLIVTTLMIQPSLYISADAMLSGIAGLLLLNAIGFAVGALLILAPLKLLNR